MATTDEGRQDVLLALARARRAIAGRDVLEATKRVCDALDGVVAALCAEPALRIDYLQVRAPAPLGEGISGEPAAGPSSPLDPGEQNG